MKKIMLLIKPFFSSKTKTIPYNSHFKWHTQGMTYPKDQRKGYPTQGYNFTSVLYEVTVCITRSTRYFKKKATG